MAGTLLFNGTPRDIVGAYAGREFILKANSRFRVKSWRTGDQVHHADEVAEKLANDHRGEGLFLVDEDAPLNSEQYRAMGRTALAAAIRATILELNTLNQTQASINKPIFFPNQQVRDLQKLLPQLDADGEKADFISKDELDGIAKKSEANLFAQMMKIAAAIESGDMEAVKAMMPQEYMKGLAAAGKAASKAKTIDAPSADETPTPPEDTGTEDAPEPPADDAVAPQPVPAADAMTDTFVTPTPTLGKGPQAVPPQARALGGRQARGPARR